MENPWKISSMYDLQYFNCPSCIFKNPSKQEIFNHAYNFHPESIEHLMNISDNSLMDILLPWDIVVKKETETNVEQNVNIGEHPLNIECLPDIKSEPFDDVTEHNEFGKDPLPFEINHQMMDYQENFKDEKNMKLTSTDPEVKKSKWKKLKQKYECVDGLYKCDQCNKTFKQPDYLRNHNAFVHGIGNRKSHQCNECSKVFKRSADFKRHVNIVHRGIKDFQCNLCGKSFDKSIHLKEHIQVVHEGIKFKCEICGDEVASSYTLKIHMKRLHQENSKTFLCDKCSFAAFSKTELEVHVEAVHEAGKNTYCCDKCGKSFNRRQYLKNHITLVHGDLSVEDRKVFNCIICNKGYTRKIALKNHISYVHKGEKKCKCEICGKDFTSNSHLKTHKITVHEGLKPHKCDFCSADYGQKGDLNRHIQKVHKVKPNLFGNVAPNAQLL